MFFHHCVQSCPQVIGVQRIAIAEDECAAIAAEVAVVTVFKSGPGAVVAVAIDRSVVVGVNESAFAVLQHLAFTCL